jgi:small conductance mechanosensitive channel
VPVVFERYRDMALAYAPRLVAALVMFVVGLWLANLVTSLVGRLMMRRRIDGSLQTFFTSLLNVSLKVLLLVSVAGIIGIQTTSFVAVIGAAGLAVGLALQGSLSNFAGGVLILVFRPIKVGDFIEVAGQLGEVKEIQIFNTVLLTPENKTAILANSAVSNGTIVNYTRHGNLRVDLSIAIAPDANVAKAKTIALNALKSHPKVLKDPAPTVNMLQVANGAVTLAVRPYAAPPDYWTVYFDSLELIKKAFDEELIAAPLPHHVILHKNYPDLAAVLSKQ